MLDQGGQLEVHTRCPNLLCCVISADVKGKGKAGVAVYGTPSHSYGVSLAIRDHTVLPSTQHK